MTKDLLLSIFFLLYFLFPLCSQAQPNRYFTISGITSSSNQLMGVGGLSIEHGWFADRYLVSVESGVSRFKMTPNRADLLIGHHPTAGKNATWEEGPSYFLQANIGYLFHSSFVTYAGIGVGSLKMVDTYIPGNLNLPDVRNKEYSVMKVIIGGGIKYRFWKGLTLDAGLFTLRGIKLGMHVMY